jgi:hypothetical protein
MRTTLTLDDDVAAKFKAEATRGDRPFRDIANETLRRGLESRRATRRRAFKWGLSLASIAELIENVEGPLHRDPRRREPAALCLPSEGGAARGKPSLARSCALGA